MGAVSLVEQENLGALAERMVPVAASFVGVVRDEDRDGVTSFLSGLTEHERAALPVILAAMVPDDLSPADLLRWVTWDEFGRPLPPDAELVLHHGGRKRGPAPSMPCGTPAAYKRHLARGERPDEACRLAGNAAQVERHRARGSRQDQQETKEGTAA